MIEHATCRGRTPAGPCSAVVQLYIDGKPTGHTLCGACRSRRGRRIVSRYRIDWTQVSDEALMDGGVCEVGKRLGCSPATVVYRRQRRGLDVGKTVGPGPDPSPPQVNDWYVLRLTTLQRAVVEGLAAGLRGLSLARRLGMDEQRLRIMITVLRSYILDRSRAD